jgi:hypothetical protein
MSDTPNPHVGSSFDDFLKAEGIEDRVQDSAVKRMGKALASPSIIAPRGLSKEEMRRFILSHAGGK